MTSATLPPILPAVVDLVKQAGVWLAAEFSRPDGPRFSDTNTAPIDTEIELFLREHLTALLPARFVGEEEGVLAAEANGYCWVVDPHDGTRAFLEGRRGSAISVGLLRRGVPVLGVVYAPTSPDRGPDLIAWAEGGVITRNGAPVIIDLSARDLTPADLVFLNHGAGQRPVWSSAACASARFMPLPSIAYRLARVAVGDGIATVTLRPVNAHDIAAGHALLTAAGGVLVAEDGLEVTYGEHGDSRPFACFGGAPAAVAALRSRTWRGSTEPRREAKVALTWPRVAEGQRFDRALGCMLGMVIGDSLGSQVEFQTADTIRAAYPGGVRDLADSPVWHTLAGQPTDDSELGLTLARGLVRMGRYDPEDAAAAYGRWYASAPFDCGTTTRLAFSAASTAIAAKAQAARNSADRASQSNGSLMRIAPIGVWARNPDDAAHFASEDSSLSHPHPVCRAACACFAAAISAALQGGDRRAMMETALRIADAADLEAAPVGAALRQAASGIAPMDFQNHMGWVLTALQNAFFHLAAGSAVEPALIETVGRGGDTDTNAAIAGALLGAADGRASLPVQWIMPVLTCRPDVALHPARPRPDEYWPDDLLEPNRGFAAKPGAIMIELDYARLTATPVATDPFPHVVVPGFVPPASLDAVLADLPPLGKRGSFPIDSVRLGPYAAGLMRAMEGPLLRAAIERLFDLDLQDAPTMVTLRGWTSDRDGRIHCDSLAKRVTVLLYLNRETGAWSRQEGCLRLLRGPDDLEDFAVEVPPVNGTLLVFPNGPTSWHGHRRFVGQRYSVQLNYMTTDDKARSEMRRHRISAFVKRLTRAA